jgi:hypothetical protein
LSRGRGTSYIRKALPLFNFPLVSLSFKGEGRNLSKNRFPFLLLQIVQVFKRATPSFNFFPLPLVKGKGIKGMGST